MRRRRRKGLTAAHWIGEKDNVAVEHSLRSPAAVASKLDDAGEHFKDALEFCRGAEYRPELAWTCLDYSEMLLENEASGDRKKITELQDEAIAIATELGMKPLLERVLAQRGMLKA